MAQAGEENLFQEKPCGLETALVIALLVIALLVIAFLARVTASWGKASFWESLIGAWGNGRIVWRKVIAIFLAISS